MNTAMIMGCCTVSAILLLRALLPRLPRRIFVLLWVGAMAVLLAPGFLSSPMSVYRLLPRAAFAEGAAAAPSVQAGSVWAIVRRTVTGLSLSGLLFSYSAGLLRLHRASPSDAPAVRDWLAAHPLLRPVRVCVGNVPAPVCGGIFLPRIVLPADANLSDRAQLDCVLSHEYTHIRRFDPLLKLLMAAALCLRWYDPLLWVVVLAAGRDMEYACDEAVLDSGVCPKRYAASLLRAALRRTERLPAAARFNAGKTERRINRICAYRPRSGLCWLAAGLFSLGLLLCFGTAPQTVSAAAPQCAKTEAAEPEQPAVRSPSIQAADPELAAHYAELAKQWTQSALQQSDPYRDLELLGEMEQIPVSLAREAMDGMYESTGATYLRVTEGEDFCTVRSYTKPED